MGVATNQEGAGPKRRPIAPNSKGWHGAVVRRTGATRPDAAMEFAPRPRVHRPEADLAV